MPVIIKIYLLRPCKKIEESYLIPGKIEEQDMEVLVCIQWEK